MLGPCSPVSAFSFTPRGGTSPHGGLGRGHLLCLGEDRGGLALHMLGSIPSASWAFLSACRWHPASWPLSHWFTLVRIVGVTQVGLPMWYEAHPGSYSRQEPLYASL